jgi:hypothetical protein
MVGEFINGWKFIYFSNGYDVLWPVALKNESRDGRCIVFMLLVLVLCNVLIINELLCIYTVVCFCCSFSPSVIFYMYCIDNFL